MTEQLPLIPVHIAPDIAALKTFLRGRGWISQRDITRITGWTDRELREIGEMDTAGEIITGNSGYKLMSESTPVEIQHCHARLKSQAVKMLRRAVRVLRAYHAMGRGAIA